MSIRLVKQTTRNVSHTLKSFPIQSKWISRKFTSKLNETNFTLELQKKNETLIKYWKSILQVPERKKWVMFSNGSVVIFIDRDESQNLSLIKDAKEIMERDGPVIAGTPQGDFEVIEIEHPEPGCVILGNNPNLLVISKDSIEEWSERDLTEVLILRMRRHLDSQELCVVACSEEDLNN